jgi:DNA-binding LacI/PurR family transcriptional regulator
MVVMADVAKAAGVSAQTVSRVLNDHPNVRRETRDKVQAAVRELGYQLNTAARSLVTGRTRTIGVMTFDAVRYGPASVLQGIGTAAQEAGYLVSVAVLRALDRGAVLDAADRLLGQAVDGLITIAPETHTAKALLSVPRVVPIVALDGSVDDSVEVVRVDEEGGARQATSHLLHLGHRTVWHLAGPPGFFAATERVDGWRSALAAAGVEIPEPLVGDWTANSGFEAGRRLAAMPEVTAVFAANDQMAVGLLRALQEGGRRVPEDVSVIGFDDIPEAAFLLPPLSTVRPDFTEVGRRCIGSLLRQLDSGSASGARQSMVQTELVIRRSSSSARR